MGCCQSKSNELIQDENYSPHDNVNNTSSDSSNQQSVPPVIISKAHSVASVDSSLSPNASANAVASDSKHPEPLENNNGSVDRTNVLEKPPAVDEEIAQVHNYVVPPSLTEQDHATSTRQAKKPIMLDHPTPETVDRPTSATSRVEADTAAPSSLSNESTAPPPASSSELSTWAVLIRTNSSSSKDTAIEIPTMEPFMTVSDLKSKIHVEPGQQIKLIHLGKILQDSSLLVPSSCSKTQFKKNAIKMTNRGVIQAMIYKKQ